MTKTRVVYITGCLGFIGSHVTRLCLSRGWKVIGVDNRTYASNDEFLDEFKQYNNFKFIHSDINDLDRLYDCDYVINLAAETHVDNSIVASDTFLRSNVNGVHHLLKLIMHKSRFRMPVLLHFSTDEVYGDIATGSHTESDLLRPSNPYSATKAAADQLICAWARTFDVPYVIVRPTNNYGIGQYVEKLIPRTVKFLQLGRPVELHDKGLPVRTWLAAKDTAAAVETIIESGVRNEIYNISGSVELPNCVVVQKILNLYFVNGENFVDTWQNYVVNAERPGQDVRYSINDSKLRALGWKPQCNFDQELIATVAWYKENFVW